MTTAPRHAHAVACELDALLEAHHWPARRNRTASTLARLLSIRDLEDAIAMRRAGKDILINA